MGKRFYRFARNALVSLFAILVVGALSGAAWYYHASQFPEGSPPPQKPSPAERPRPVAVIVLDPSTQPTPAESSLPLQPVDTRPPVTISIRPLERFAKDLRSALVKEFAVSYPQLSDLNPDANGFDAHYRNSAFQFLHAAEGAPAARQPAMLLAADFLLAPVWCPSEYKEKCDEVRNQFTEHKLSLPYSELDGGSYYRHDLLWRVWQDYPSSEWGERAFVMLLSSGWDPSGTCSKGSDQFREVIRQGESFLAQHPDSTQRPVVMHLVGQAYATWWSLSNTPSPGMEDYVDPKTYQQGSEQARLKAINYFQQVLDLSPDTELGEYSRNIIPALQEKQLTSDSYNFFCVYD